MTKEKESTKKESKVPKGYAKLCFMILAVGLVLLGLAIWVTKYLYGPAVIILFLDVLAFAEMLPEGESDRSGCH